MHVRSCWVRATVPAQIGLFCRSPGGGGVSRPAAIRCHTIGDLGEAALRSGDPLGIGVCMQEMEARSGNPHHWRCMPGTGRVAGVSGFPALGWLPRAGSFTA
jgi:hypothetical protein